MSEEQIRAIIQDELQKYSQNNMFDVSNVPIHTHNGTDSVPIPISSILTSIPIDATAAGVLNENVLDSQKVNNEYTTGRKNPQSIYVLPVNVIYGNGVGIHSAFNGGDAEPGTMVFFENGLTLSGLWIKTINGWYGISPDMTI